MNYLKKFFPVLIGIITLLTSCVEPTDIGQELLEDDFIGNGYLDQSQIELHSRTVKSDSLKTYTPGSTVSSFYVGNMVDEYYGTLRTAFTFEAGLYRTGGGAELNSPQFKNYFLDSVVMVLQLDKSKSYGFINEVFDLHFNELDMRLDANQDYYSNFTPKLNPFRGLDQRFYYFPRVENTATIDYTNEFDFDLDPDTIKFKHVRFKLDEAFGQRLMNADSLVFLLDSTFLDFFNGIQISSTSRNSGIIAFNKLSQGRGDALGGIYVYFKDDSGHLGQYKFSFNDFRVRTAQYYHDYRHAAVEPFLETPTLGDSISFVQGLAGLNTVITLPSLFDLKNKIINKAVLKVYIAKLGDNTFYNDPVEQMVVMYRDENGDLQEVQDFAFSASSTALVFGGVIVKGESGEPDYYELNISNHLQKIIDGEAPNEIYLGCYQSATTPNRVALYGAGHSQYPMELKVSFTDPK